MGLFTTVEHPAAGQIQFKHGDDFQCHARLGERFVGYESGMPPDGIYWGIGGGYASDWTWWLVAVKGHVAVACERATDDGAGDRDDLTEWPQQAAQVAALCEKWGVPWEG